MSNLSCNSNIGLNKLTETTKHLGVQDFCGKIGFLQSFVVKLVSCEQAAEISPPRHKIR